MWLNYIGIEVHTTNSICAKISDKSSKLSVVDLARFFQQPAEDFPRTCGGVKIVPARREPVWSSSYSQSVLADANHGVSVVIRGPAANTTPSQTGLQQHCTANTRRKPNRGFANRMLSKFYRSTGPTEFKQFKQYLSIARVVSGVYSISTVWDNSVQKRHICSNDKYQCVFRRAHILSISISFFRTNKCLERITRPPLGYYIDPFRSCKYSLFICMLWIVNVWGIVCIVDQNVKVSIWYFYYCLKFMYRRDFIK